MTLEQFSTVVQSLAALIGIPVLLWQLRQVRKGMFTQSLTAIYGNYLELDRFFIERPELRAVIYDNLPLDQIDPALHPQLDATAEYVLDVLYQSYAQREFLGEKAYLGDACYLRRVGRSPVIQSFLARHGEQFDDAFVAFVTAKE